MKQVKKVKEVMEIGKEIRKEVMEIKREVTKVKKIKQVTEA